MRIQSIDFLRGLAVILVIFRHIVFEPFFMVMGWVGVDLFFVLSGFLVSNLLFKEYETTGSVKPIRFLIRRGLKIYPLYYLMITLLFGILVYREPTYYHVYAANLPNELMFLQNYRYDKVLIGHTWSIAVEEHFYLGLTVLLFLFAQFRLIKNKVFFNVLSVVIFFLCLNMRYNIVHVKGAEMGFGDYLIPTHLRMDTLWVGVFLAYHYNFSKEKFTQIFQKGGWLGFGLVAPLVASNYGLEKPFLATLGLSIIALSFGGTLAALVVHEDSEALLKRLFGSVFVDFIAKIGTFSYAIYLFHMMIIWYGEPFKSSGSYNTWESRANFVIVFGITCLVGFLATKYIEQPVLRWRDRVFPSK
jgi:peptidoglycan/LPS O-acetylase OafA/YrhL